MNNLERQLLRHEGLKLKPYRDTVGKLTIGIGRNLDDNGISESEALTMLRNDIAEVKSSLERFKWYERIDANRQDVIANMCFNMGLPTLLKFKRMIKALEDHNYNQAANEMLDSKWAQQVGNRAVELARIMRNDL
jgi:lysozyme